MSKSVPKVSLPGGISPILENRLLELIFKKKVYYNHPIDKCVYFIISNQLFGYQEIKFQHPINAKTKLFWKDDAKYTIEDGILIKDNTASFIILDNDDDLIRLFEELKNYIE